MRHSHVDTHDLVKKRLEEGHGIHVRSGGLAIPRPQMLSASSVKLIMLVVVSKPANMIERICEMASQRLVRVVRSGDVLAYAKMLITLRFLVPETSLPTLVSMSSSATLCASRLFRRNFANPSPVCSIIMVGRLNKIHFHNDRIPQCAETVLRQLSSCQIRVFLHD